MTRGVLFLLAGLLLAGCTTTDPGTPVAGDRPSETTTTAESTTTTTGGNRPRNIDMAAVDICAVFTALPRASLGLEDNRPPLAGDSRIFPGSKDCFSANVATGLSLGLIAVVTTGAAEYVDGASARVSETDVDGFRLYVITTASQADCFGALDVNDGQMLNIQYSVNSSDSAPVASQAELCQRIPEIAKAALVNL